MLFQALASGSNGNCSIFSTENGTILIDAGISRKRIIEGLSAHNISPSDVIGILVTHAHADHIAGLPVLSRFVKSPVIATKETINELNKLAYRDIRFASIAENAKPVQPAIPLELGPFVITAYETLHDIDGSCGFTLEYDDYRISYATDTGTLFDPFISSMKSSDMVFLESNHEKELLYNSRRPTWLKKRIRDTHLSNDETIKLLKKITSEHTKVLYLGHLSGECNAPKYVVSEIQKIKQNNEYDWNWVVCSRKNKSSILRYKSRKLDLIGGISNINPPTFREQNNDNSPNLDEFF